MSDRYSWIFAGGHSPVLGQGPKQKVSEGGVQGQQNNQKIGGGGAGKPVKKATIWVKKQENRIFKEEMSIEKDPEVTQIPQLAGSN